MSRSFRKTKIFGNTGASSEKKGKRIMNRIFRRATKSKLSIESIEDETLDFWFNKNQAYNVWSMEKDGKHYWKDAPAKYLRK